MNQTFSLQNWLFRSMRVVFCLIKFIVFIDTVIKISLMDSDIYIIDATKKHLELVNLYQTTTHTFKSILLYTFICISLIILEWLISAKNIMSQKCVCDILPKKCNVKFFIYFYTTREITKLIRALMRIRNLRYIKFYNAFTWFNISRRNIESTL